MGLCLIATVWYLDIDAWIAIVKVAVALGMVIFVHELGHFAVAKLCGVKCEKFYLGFDIAGLKFCKFTWGETEYGIGVLPLGGYVKMLGQEDNPARLQAEIERAKQQQTGEQTAEQTSPQTGQQTAASEQGENSPPQEPTQPEAEQPDIGEIDLEAAQQALYNPRSYLAKSVPKRMAIISAGVIMNLAFAFVMAAVAFGIGVERRKCVVGQTVAGEGAWRENIRVGDEIVEIAGRKIEKFRDLQEEVSLGDDIEKGIPVVVRRPGAKDLLAFSVTPDSSGLLPKIGITSSLSTTLQEKGLAVLPGSAAAMATPNFELADQIVQINNTPIQSYADLCACLAMHPDDPLVVTVKRKVTAANAESIASPVKKESLVHIDVPPCPMRRLGVVMKMGRIAAIQKDSPAAKAGIGPGDLITAIDGKPPGDPMTLPDRLRRRAGEAVTLTIKRGEAKTESTEDVPVTLRPADWWEMPSGSAALVSDKPLVSVPSLGIAYQVLNRVESVIEGSPAAKAGLRPADRIVSAKLLLPEQQTPDQEELGQKTARLELNEKSQNWPILIYVLQELLPGTRVELQWIRQREEMTQTLQPADDEDWHNADRGLLLEPLTFVEKASSFDEAIRLGADETLNATLLVYRFLRKLGSSQISAKAVGGPITIFAVAKQRAEQSNSELLIFLTMLSANLAVINFLPIPLLDGGHMVLLAWEGIRGKPADERVQLALTYMGLAMILSLMIWVIGLDIFRLFGGF